MSETAFPETLSYWEVDQYLSNTDLLIIGSGIVGLTTAIFFKKKHPKAKVLIAEKGFLPSGASTKNAGFACFGSLSEILSDLKTHCREDVFTLIKDRYTGLLALQNLVGKPGIGFEPLGGYELFRKTDAISFDECASFLAEANKQVAERLNLKNAYVTYSKNKEEFGFRDLDGIILNKFEGAIDTGKMMHQLIRLASSLDIKILNGFELKHWSSIGSNVSACFTNGLELKVSHLHFATNGFAKQLTPELNVKPARAQVLITTPISNLNFKGTFHLEEGFYYFRNVGNRVLLGGGRNLDLEGETTSEIQITDKIQSKLDELLREVILPDNSFQIEHRWAGIMGVGNSKKPIVKHISEGVSCAVRLGGMGVALGTSIGKSSAELIGQ